MPGIGPAPAANTMISISPSQNVGTDQKVSATPVLTRSLTLPCRQPFRIPSHSPSTAEITVAVPTSRMVGPSFSPISPATDSDPRYWYDVPRSSCASWPT